MQDEEQTLQGQVRAAQEAVHAALCNNVDTKEALRQLSELVGAVNKYLLTRPVDKSPTATGALPMCTCVPGGYYEPFSNGVSLHLGSACIQYHPTIQSQADCPL